MSSFQIKPNPRGGYLAILDGHDVSHLIAADGGVTIRLVEGDFGSRPEVTLRLAGSVQVDADLPDALVAAIRPAGDVGLVAH